MIPVKIIQKKKKKQEYAKVTELNAATSQQWRELFTLLDRNGNETDNFALAHIIQANRHFASVGGISAFGYAGTEIGIGGGGTNADFSAQNIIDALGYTPVNPAQLGSMAYKDTDDYALASQLSSYALKSQLGSMAYKDTDDYALASQLSSYALKSQLGSMAYEDTDDYALASQLSSYALKTQLGSMAYEDTDGYALESQLSSYALKSQLGSMAYKDTDGYALESQLGSMAYEDTDSYVTTDTEQTISAAKWFQSTYMFFESRYSFFGKNGIYIEPGSDTFIGHHTGQTGDTGFLYFKSDGTTQFVGNLMRGYYNDVRTIIGAGGIELYHATPHIDFHADLADDDYTLRIIESETGVLEVLGNAIKIGNAYLTFDYDNNALCITGKDGKQINAYTTGGFSAFSGLPQYSTLNNLTLNNLLTVKNINITDGFLNDISLNLHNITDCTNITALNIDTENINTENINTPNVNAQKITFSSGNNISNINADSQHLYITINNKTYTISLQ